MKKAKDITEEELNMEIRMMLNMKEEDLIAISENPKSKAYQKLISRTLLRSISKGSIMQINILLERLFGKPFVKEVDTTNIPNKIEVRFTKNEK